MSRSDIQKRMRLEEKQVLELTQISNLASRIKKEDAGGKSGATTTGELAQWCIDHQYNGSITDPKKLFVLPGFICEPGSVFVFMTSLEMLKNLGHRPYLSVDATYKTNHEQLPFVVMGTSDLRRKFFPAAVAIISSHESTADYRKCFR